jgi:K+-transporting ATPase KdpF subunit
MVMGKLRRFLALIPLIGVRTNENYEMNNNSWYIASVFLALLILCYLLFALFKPEKF